MIARFLIDTSAAARMRLVAFADRLETLTTGGLVATCATLDAEAPSSARSPAEYEQVRADRREAYEYLPTDDGHWQVPSTPSLSWLAPAGTERWDRRSADRRPGG